MTDFERPFWWLLPGSPMEMRGYLKRLESLRARGCEVEEFQDELIIKPPASLKSIELDFSLFEMKLMSQALRNEQCD